MSSVTVIIPTCNRKDLLYRALRSVTAQTRPADQIIVIDDGSTDGTAKMLNEHFPEVEYVFQRNNGVSVARNRGIELAKSEWLAFLDSDDEWLPAKLEQQLGVLHEHPDYKVCHSEEIWVRNGIRVNPKHKHKKYGGWIFKKCLPLCAMSPSSIMIHRSVFKQFGVFDPALPACEDYDMWLRICATLPVLFIDQPLIIKYGGHQDQLSRQFWGMDRFRIAALEKIIKSGRLDPDDGRAACEMLCDKIAVYLQGAKKRNKQSEITHYESLLSQLAQQSPHQSSSRLPGQAAAKTVNGIPGLP